MREIKYLVVHCTATSQGAKVSSIINYWKNNLGWKSPGYHILIEPNGTKNRLQNDNLSTNGVKNYNYCSLHVSYIGGVGEHGKPSDNRTNEQKIALLEVLKEWKAKYPEAIIQGHRDFNGVVKACPSFDAKTEYASL